MKSERVERVLAAKAIMRCMRSGPALRRKLAGWAGLIETAMMTDPGDRGMSSVQVDTLVLVKREIRGVAELPENWFERDALLGVLLLLMP